MKVMVAMMVAGMLLGGCGDPGSGPGDEAIALNNRGVALMGKFEYGEAVRVFQDLVSAVPDWSLARANLAVATLNRQQPGDEAKALELLEGIIQEQPGALRAHYLAGILQFNAGDSEAALEHFLVVATGDPEDAYAQYFSGQSLMQLGQPDRALEYFERAAELDPYLRSAAYGRFLARQQLRDRDGARQALAEYEKLEGNPRSRLAEIKYTRMGPKAMAYAVRPQQDPSDPGVPDGDLFQPAEPVAGPLTDAPASVAIFGDGETATLAIASASGILLCPLGAVCDTLPLPGTVGATAAAWGDYDNDGFVDLYVARQAGNRLLRGDADGGLTDVTEQTGTSGNGHTADVAFVDADHDGDLDLLLAQLDMPSELLSNDGNGRFRSLDEFTGPLISARQIIAADLDRDRDLDLVLLAATPPHQVLINDRLWQYRNAANWGALSDRPMAAAAVADLDVDGSQELVGISAGKLMVWQIDGPGLIEKRHLELDSNADRLWLTDVVGAGSYQALTGSADGWQLWDLVSGERLASGPELPLALVHGRGGVALISSSESGLALHTPGTGRWPVTLLSFSGQDDTSQSMRSNASGLGATFVARSGPVWVAGSSLAPAAVPGQSLQPAVVGSAGKDLDSLAVDWSDGVYQSELNLAGGTRHLVVETQRQLASCPVLFVGDGNSWRFVTDVLGVGGMGFNVGFGQYAPPRPRESLLLPIQSWSSDQPPSIMIAEPMEESAYIDRVRLTAVDVPPGWELLLDERMGTGEPAVTGALVWAREILAPVSAVDGQGRTVLEAVKTRDQQAAPLPPLERQLLGLLSERQVITLEFDRDLSRLADPVLIVDGWVEYGYSQTSFAAWQQGRRYDSLSLEIFVDGRWKMWLPEFGYPAGMPREASVPLGRLPEGVQKLRLSTDQQIYLDRLAVANQEAKPAHGARPLALHSAVLRRVGFPRRSNGSQMQPGYDFDQRQPFWDTRYPRGLYTRLGDVAELVAEHDNALAIVGPGDGLVLEFIGDLPPPANGWTRRWLLQFDGWAKDMDLLTRDGETVGPLPRTEVAFDRSRALHDRFNLRFQQGR